jgi:hypothetical protein
MPVICHEEAEADHEDGGAQEGFAQHLLDALPATGLLLAERGGDVVEFGGDVCVRVDLLEHRASLVTTAPHHVPAGGIGQPGQQQQQQQQDENPWDGGHSEHPAPALGAGQRPGDPVPQDDAGHGRDLVQHQQRAADRGGGGLGDDTGTTTTETPIVRPSSGRATISDDTGQASADSRENAAKVPATSTIDFLRPIRLASAPPNSAPTTSPTTTAVVTSSCC